MRWFTNIDPLVQIIIFIVFASIVGVIVDGARDIAKEIYKQPVQIICFEGQQYTIKENNELTPIFISKDGTKIPVSCP
jgi:hypothetical protein